MKIKSSVLILNTRTVYVDGECVGCIEKEKGGAWVFSDINNNRIYCVFGYTLSEVYESIKKHLKKTTVIHPAECTREADCPCPSCNI